MHSIIPPEELLDLSVLSILIFNPHPSVCLLTLGGGGGRDEHDGRERWLPSLCHFPATFQRAAPPRSDVLPFNDCVTSFPGEKPPTHSGKRPFSNSNFQHLGLYNSQEVSSQGWLRKRNPAYQLYFPNVGLLFFLFILKCASSAGTPPTGNQPN